MILYGEESEVCTANTIMIAATRVLKIYFKAQSTHKHVGMVTVTCLLNTGMIITDNNSFHFNLFLFRGKGLSQYQSIISEGIIFLKGIVLIVCVKYFTTIHLFT